MSPRRVEPWRSAAKRRNHAGRPTGDFARWRSNKVSRTAVSLRGVLVNLLSMLYYLFSNKNPPQVGRDFYPTNFCQNVFFLGCFLRLRRGAFMVVFFASKCWAFFFFASVDGACASKTSSVLTVSGATR